MADAVMMRMPWLVDNTGQRCGQESKRGVVVEVENGLYVVCKSIKPTCDTIE